MLCRKHPDFAYCNSTTPLTNPILSNTIIVLGGMVMNKRFETWEIVLLALGSPIWLSILIAILSIIFSLYVSVWSVIISLWAVFGSLIACAFCGVVSGMMFFFTNYTLTAIAMIGAALVCAGLSIFFFFGCKLATEGMILLTKKCALAIKNKFVKRGKLNE